MTEIEQRQADRWLVLKTIYDAADGSLSTSVSGQDLLDALGMPDQQLGDACNFLEDKHLIKSLAVAWEHYTPYHVNISRRGIEEIEKSLQTPGQPTHYFPPAISIVHIEGNNVGSPIQSGSPGAKQDVTSNVNIPDIQEFISKLKAAAPELDLSDEDRDELTAEIATVEAQINSPKPKKQIISESLHSIRAILEGTTGALAATGFLEIIPHIRL